MKKPVDTEVLFDHFNEFIFRDESKIECLVEQMEATPKPSKILIRAVLNNLRSQTRWIREREAQMDGECERIAHIADTMKEHGLATYTKGDVTLTAHRSSARKTPRK